MSSPFKPANSLPRRLKLFVYGGSGSGKTTLALQFPMPVVIDTERGTERYGEAFKFDVHHTVSFADALRSVEWLATQKHDYKTLVIDPVTILWASCQAEFLAKRLEEEEAKPAKYRSAGYRGDRYEMQINDWNPLKAHWKSLMRLLTTVDMNVIVTAHQKAEYSDAAGDVMKKIGVTFDGEKSLDYVFDTVVRVEKYSGKHIGHVIKERYANGKHLPDKPFDLSYKVFEQVYGGDLTRKVEPVKYATDDDVAQIKFICDFMGVSSDAVKKGLARFGCESFKELRAEQVAEVIDNLRVTYDSMVKKDAGFAGKVKEYETKTKTTIFKEKK